MADSARTKRRLTGRVSLLALTLLVAVTGTVTLLVGDRSQLSAAFLPANFSRPATALNASGTFGRPGIPSQEAEVLLVKTLAEIRQNRMDNALTEIEKVIGAYPNFRLAHLIKGDLLG